MAGRTTTPGKQPSLGVEEQSGDEDDNNGQELEETHTNQSVGEEVLLHGWVAGHTDDKGCEELADTLCTTSDRDHRDCATEHGHASIPLGEWRSESCNGRRFCCC